MMENPSRRLLLSGLAATGLAACSGPSNLIGTPFVEGDAFTPGRTIDVFIATTRRASEKPGEFFSGNRSTRLSFAAVKVRIPPNHVPGQIERPRRLPANADDHFLITAPRSFPTAEGLSGEIAKSIRANGTGNRDILVFIHGFNQNLTSAILHAAQFVHDSGYRGVPIVFSWASKGSFTGYLYDQNSAFMARDALLELGPALDSSDVRGWDILAHSMGSLVTMEALRQAAIQGFFDRSGKLRNVILASPDIDLELFQQQLRAIPPSQREFVILTSADDRALALSGRLAGSRPRVGQVDPRILSQLGVNVIDLSQVEDTSSIDHSKFSESPEVVQLVGNRILEGDTFGQGSQLSLGQSIAVGVDGSLELLESAF